MEVETLNEQLIEQAEDIKQLIAHNQMLQAELDEYL